MKLPGGPQTWEVPPPTMVKSPPFAPKYPSETTIIQINACRRSRLYISAMVTKVIRRILTDCVHFSRSEEHTSELQSLMRISYTVFCLKKKNNTRTTQD